MIILLYIYYAFLFVFFAYCVYAATRIYSMRIKGDATVFGILIYLAGMVFVVVVCAVIISRLDWPATIGGIKIWK